MLLFKISRWLCFLVSLFLPCNGSLQPGFSQLQWGHRLDRKMIQSFGQLSFLDCVIECLVTPRCKSVNYFKGANFCETNYEKKNRPGAKYEVSAGWVYSEKEHWPQDLAGSCANSNCHINQTCKNKRYSKDTFYECVLSDCGIPNRTGINLNTTKREDAIGIYRRIHASCSDGYFQFGSGRLICQSNGEWKYDILCEEGWIQNKDHVYRLFTVKKTWNNAKEYCKSKDAYLVEIESMEENTWIRKNIRFQHFLGMDTCIGNVFCASVWTGGTDEANERNFIWTGSNENVQFENWAQNNPNNYDENEHCIRLLVNGEWSDYNCDTIMAFICEKTVNK